MSAISETISPTLSQSSSNGKRFGPNKAAWLLELERGLLASRCEAPAAMRTLGLKREVLETGSPEREVSSSPKDLAAENELDGKVLPPTAQRELAEDFKAKLVGEQSGRSLYFDGTGNEAGIGSAGSSPRSGPSEQRPMAHFGFARAEYQLARRTSAVERSTQVLQPDESNSSDVPSDTSRPAVSEQAGTRFSARQLHLFYGTQGVQAWVRDTSLSLNQASLVARSLRYELGVNGVRLAAISVNGKPMMIDALTGAVPTEIPVNYGPSGQGQY